MRKAVVAGMALAMLLCGCTGGEHGREPEDTVLAQVFGVDRMGGLCLLTAAGPNGKGETVIQSSEGESFAEAFAALPGSGKEWMSVKNVTHILLGDGVDPEEVLSFILDDSGLSWRSYVWYAPIAGAVIGEEKDGGMGRLDVLEQAGVETTSVLDVLAELKETGETSVPMLARVDGQLEISGRLKYEMKRVE